jgi:serine/alanine adding enzyme
VSIPHSFFHSNDCIKAICKTHPLESTIYKFEENDKIAVVPLQHRAYQSYFDKLTPYAYSGLIGNNLDLHFLRRIEQELASEGIIASYITNHPLFTPSSLIVEAHYFKANNSYINDLSLPIEQLVANLNDGKKRQIKIKNGILISDKSRLLNSFINLYESSMKRLGAGSFYFFSEETIKDLVSCPQTTLLGVIQNDEVVACTLFGHTPYISDFLLNGATDEGRKFSSALLWAGMIEAKEKGIPYFNFGGGITPGDSLEQFKSLFGGQAYPFGAFKFIHDERKYAELCLEKNILNHTDRSGFFPAYHKRTN